MRISDWSSDVCSSDLERLARQLAITWKITHSVIDVTVIGLVGQAVLFKALDDSQHFAHMLGGARLKVGRSHPQGTLIGVLGVNEKRSDLAHALPVPFRAPYDFVVARSEEHTFVLSSLMRIYYLLFSFNKKYFISVHI